MLEWNVYIADFNHKRIETYNILNNTAFLADCKKTLKKFKEDKKEFEKTAQSSLMYYYWSKCEWEIILSSFPSWESFKEEKIDVYDQVKLNWNVFIDYLWDHRKEILKIK